MPRTDVSALVKRIRRSRGLTQEGLARELGVTFSTVNGWENGRHRPIPALEMALERMAQESSDVPRRVVEAAPRRRRATRRGEG